MQLDCAFPKEPSAAERRTMDIFNSDKEPLIGYAQLRRAISDPDKVRYAYFQWDEMRFHIYYD